MARRNRLPEDMLPYVGAPDETILGLAPLAVGFLRRNAPFPTGQTPALFRARLLDFCLPEHTLQVVATPLACGLGCGRVAPFMREVMNGLGDAVAASGRAELVADVCEP